LILPVNGAAAKPDKKRSQAEYQRRGSRRRSGAADEAISAYSEADPGGRHQRGGVARARQGLPAPRATNEKAAADLDRGHQASARRRAESYAVRLGSSSPPTNQPDRAILDCGPHRFEIRAYGGL